MPTDPVCGMYVPETAELKTFVDGKIYYFCSRACQEKFISPQKELRKLKIRLIVAWSFPLPILIINYFVPVIFFHGLENKYLSMLFLAIPVQFYSGLSFYQGAYHSLKNRTGNMDLLITIGTMTAFIFSAFVTFYPDRIPSSSVYFDASSFIITMILTGNYIENITKEKADGSAKKLLSLIPRITHLIKEDGSIQDISTENLANGNKILVKPGELIPADGIVFEGTSEVDESLLTGEQMPTLKSYGDPVSSGTKNINGILKIDVTKTGKDSTIDQIYEMIQGAISGRAKIQRIADVFSNVFVPVVMVAALLSGIFWYIYLSHLHYPFSLDVAILAFVSVIVIACPCAIGLAGPIALLISSNYASENGILIKNSSSLDRFSRVNRIVFDKSGTLTEPEPKIERIVSKEGFSDIDVLKYAASIEKFSNHPVARSIFKEAVRRNIEIIEAKNIKEIPGIGVEGEVDKFIISINRKINTSFSEVEISLNDKTIGEIFLSYEIRKSAFPTVSYLKEMGIKITMVTGDSESEAYRVANILGIDDVHYRILPEGKADIIKEYQMNGDFVAFVGDGINDAIALEVADVGIAMSSGSDIAKESGDIILVNNDLRNLILIRIISRKTIDKIKQNIGWAIGYNATLIPIAGGLLVPLFGIQIYQILPIFSAFAMGMSSSSVVINSLLLRRNIEKEKKLMESKLSIV